MKRLWLFTPVAALTLAVGWTAYQMGRDVSDTEIIERYAARYVEALGTGAMVTDCVARPGDGARVRMVIDCQHPSGKSWQVMVDPRGMSVPHFRQGEGEA